MRGGHGLDFSHTNKPQALLFDDFDHRKGKVVNITSAIYVWRLHNPASRAVDHTTWYGSGGKARRAYCVYCGTLCATSAAEWPETRRSMRERTEHGEACAKQYLRRKRLSRKTAWDIVRLMQVLQRMEYGLGSKETREILRDALREKSLEKYIGFYDLMSNPTR